MIRSFAEAAVLLSVVALLAGCPEETKANAGDAEAPKTAATVSAPAATVATATASTTAAPSVADAGALEPKDAGHDGSAKAAPKK